MLDDDHAIALGLKPAQAGNELVGIAGVKARRWLVENVADAHQPGTSCVASRARCSSPPESVSAPRQGQVAQADLLEEAQPASDLADEGPGDRLLGRVKIDLLELPPHRLDRHRGDLVDRPASDAHRPRSGRKRVPPHAGQGIFSSPVSAAAIAPRPSQVGQAP